MKDALAAAPGGGLDYYSYEPFQIYGAGWVNWNQPGLNFQARLPQLL